MIEPLPCPFCGKVGVDICETTTFRWRVAQCQHCGAQGAEIRVQTLGEGTKEEWEAQAREDAIEEWNRRVP
jgi:Lar family restriction alleviation protein